MNKVKLVLLFLALSCSAIAQNKKNTEALLIEEPLKIDAVLDETVYQRVQPAADFLQLEPYNGQPSMQPSEVFFFYDQSAVYLGAMLYDSAPDSIFNFLSARDNMGMSDYFGVYFDPYNQGQLSYGFFITPAGVQSDIKAIKSDRDREDGNWDAVWESKTRITDEGWIIEMRIPYSALRFPDQPVHTWGLNMFRNIRRYNSNNSWSFIDRNVNGFIHQQGELTGIKDIKPPLRLSFSPYLATYWENNEADQTSSFTYKGGLDLKYGISESYTLDMMVIPDFGQIQSDDKQLNLSPYEIYYSERRQFFTEGVELFQRGDIFYSRRIGSRPKFALNKNRDLEKKDTIYHQPSETQLINATKVSGRGKNGLAVGILNAMSLESYATIQDTANNTFRDTLIQPFTNYNVAVIDQSLKNNSYVSLINTNMSMYGDPFMANVTATEFQFRDKSLNYALSGKGGISHRGRETKETGWFSELELAKNGGTWQYGIETTAISDDYNPNDMGYLRRNNRFDTELSLRFRQVEPFSVFRDMFTRMWYEQNRIIKPWDLNNHELGIYTEWKFMNNYGFEMRGVWFSDERNYDEPRVAGRYFNKPQGYNFNLFVHSDFTKMFNVYAYRGYFVRPENDLKANWVGVGLGLRLGQRINLDYELSYNTEENDYGYVDDTHVDSIHFSRRNLHTVENVLKMDYTFNNKLSLNLRGRHYWASVENMEYYLLQKNGDLKPNDEYKENNDKNYNLFNIDMFVRWVFAPGSEMILSWKNIIEDETKLVNAKYLDNLKNTWKLDQTNTISLKVLYYIDYNNIFKGKA
ncbi:DUF5916 domain-containing protein [Carboxylicivirga sp. N1Y90]|uniref:DUF5916 domain-containing protein n=1 Tax=Carboxylicivirga fragile TaxID=3417571 RepID=UPI003D33A3D2|nr:carbohydrate binding family 9 domain-containing protein [Marinilabiliaceae bacterium N1Y90]